MDTRWVKIDAWHIAEDTWLPRGGANYLVKTKCGIERLWDGTFLDRLPGGTEKSCENCLKLLAGSVDEPAPAKPRTARRTTSSKKRRR